MSKDNESDFLSLKKEPLYINKKYLIPYSNIEYLTVYDPKKVPTNPYLITYPNIIYQTLYNPKKAEKS